MAASAIQIDVTVQFRLINHPANTNANTNQKQFQEAGAPAMSLNLFNRRRGKGEILKAERMLVRIERIDNPNQIFPAEYNEAHSLNTRLKRVWKEYYVVARAPHDENKHIVLHIHKSRVRFLRID